MVPVKELVDAACAKDQANLQEEIVEPALQASFRCKAYVDIVKEVVEISDEDYEWFEDENGHWYYKEKANPNSEWKLWEDDDKAQVETSEIETKPISSTNPVIYCENMNWDLLNQKIKKLDPKCNLLRINVDENIMSYLQVASENETLTKKSRVEIFPNINPKKMNKLLSKNKYKNNHLIGMEDILMFADDTQFPFRNGNNGMMITTAGIFTSATLRNGFLPWRIGNSRVKSFIEEKSFLVRTIIAILDTGESLEIFTSSDPDLKNNLEELPAFLTILADAANHAYCLENGIDFTSIFDESEEVDFDGEYGLEGDCPNCGSSMRDASLAARGGKSMLRGFAKLHRSMERQAGYSHSFFGKSGGIFDKATADKSRVCDNCGYKF